MKRSFLMLAEKFDEKKSHSPANWFASEKLDGIRAFWDSGITRGMPVEEVPWANVAKNARYRESQYSTGLWTRYGHPIQAPTWWLDQLPRYSLDGELYIGRSAFQALTSTVKKLNPVNYEWKMVTYQVFDTPPLQVIFHDGEINETNFKKRFSGIWSWIQEIKDPNWQGDLIHRFEGLYNHLQRNKESLENEVVKILTQEQLPATTAAAMLRIDEKMDEITRAGGEGLILRNPISLWIPERSKQVLKVKPALDAEGIVTGYVAGRKTDLGSKLLGMMGALILDFRGKRLELSGFTDEERKFADDHCSTYAAAHPGEDMPFLVSNPKFPRGAKVTFKYRELSDEGIPKEARYFRRRA